MAEFQEEYYKSFEIKLIYDNEWIYSVKPPKELSHISSLSSNFMCGASSKEAAIANAKARIDEAISQKVEELESQLDLLKSFNGDDDKNVKVGSIVEISFIDPEIEPNQKIVAQVKLIKYEQEDVIPYINCSGTLLYGSDEDCISLEDESYIYKGQLFGSFGQVAGPYFSGGFGIDWKVIQE